MIRSGHFFELEQDFIHVHIISKFKEHPIKTEQVIKMTKSNRGFVSNQGDVTLLIVGSGQFFNLSEILSMPHYLQVSGTSDQN